MSQNFSIFSKIIILASVLNTPHIFASNGGSSSSSSAAFESMEGQGPLSPLVMAKDWHDSLPGQIANVRAYYEGRMATPSDDPAGKSLKLILGVTNWEDEDADSFKSGIPDHLLLKNRFDGSYIFLSEGQDPNAPDYNRCLSVDFNNLDHLAMLSGGLGGIFDEIIFDDSTTKFVRWSYDHLFHINALLKNGGRFIYPAIVQKDLMRYTTMDAFNRDVKKGLSYDLKMFPNSLAPLQAYSTNKHMFEFATEENTVRHILQNNYVPLFKAVFGGDVTCDPAGTFDQFLTAGSRYDQKKEEKHIFIVARKDGAHVPRPLAVADAAAIYQDVLNRVNILNALSHERVQTHKTMVTTSDHPMTDVVRALIDGHRAASASWTDLVATYGDTINHSYKLSETFKIGQQTIKDLNAQITFQTTMADRTFAYTEESFRTQSAEKQDKILLLGRQKLKDLNKQKNPIVFGLLEQKIQTFQSIRDQR